MIKSMLVIPTHIKLNELRRGSNYELAETGNHTYPIGAYLPIFKQGKGTCLGLAQITGYKCDTNKTVVQFTNVYRELTDDAKEAFTILYSLNSGSSVLGAEEDPYENPDVSFTASLLTGNQPRPKRRHDDDEVIGLAALMKQNKRY